MEAEFEVVAAWPGSNDSSLPKETVGRRGDNMVRLAYERKGERWAGGRCSDGSAEEARGEAKLRAAILRVMADHLGDLMAWDTPAPQLCVARGKRPRKGGAALWHRRIGGQQSRVDQGLARGGRANIGGLVRWRRVTTAVAVPVGARVR